MGDGQAGAGEREVRRRCRARALRSNAGLYYESYAEFAEALHAITSSASLSDTLGRNGRDISRHYAWPVIERKYLEMFDRLDAEPKAEQPVMTPLPGFFARRRADASGRTDGP